MLDRLLGLETEYALRFSAPPGTHPGNDVLFTALSRAVRTLVSTSPEPRDEAAAQLFTQNGGALYYEVLPEALHGGLLEACTPECRRPSQLVLYQKAQEALLLRALPLAERALVDAGVPGALGLVKNGRDAAGHVFGAQENYEVELARGPWRLVHHVGLALILLLVPLQLAVFWGLGLAIYVGVELARSWRARLRRWRGAPHADEISPELGRFALIVEHLLRSVLVAPYALLLRVVAFRAVRRSMTAFLVSRPIVTGTGTLDPPDHFGLSEKGPAIERVLRTSSAPSNRPIYDTNNLLGALSSIVSLRGRAVLALFRRRQRLQLGLSDSNASQLAEYLKVGTTALVLDLVEAGWADDAPVLASPITALRAIITDPSLTVAVNVARGPKPMMTALELQRWYLERARRFVAESSVASLEAHELVRLWAEALDALATDPAKLVGRLDWVTKRWLVETVGRDAGFAARKKLDLKYHELGVGYLAHLERAGLAPIIVDPADVERAILEPPDETPAKLRGRLVRELSGASVPIAVSWDAVRIGGRARGRTIRLVDEERERSET
ncbi:proteasome accessory factor PafA2 family protein [Myxococcota bacterium]|nr:proteasome accessory factor PafA2 family protein [Myxococcota bacterium]